MFAGASCVTDSSDLPFGVVDTISLQLAAILSPVDLEQM